MSFMRDVIGIKLINLKHSIGIREKAFLVYTTFKYLTYLTCFSRWIYYEIYKFYNLQSFLTHLCLFN